MSSIAPPKPDIAEIAERITTAVMEHRLGPGMKLAEERLATAFGVSRTKVRQALTALSREGLVKLHPNRGAFVTSPTVEETLALFATRRLIEPEILRNVILRADKSTFRLLHAHLAAEADARRQQDRRLVIKLSGGFHMLLAELAGNSFLEKLMAELCPLTCLIIALYDAPQTPACPDDEHEGIVRAIERKDEATAVRLMLHHLDHIQSALKLGKAKPDIDWDTMFA